jgi:hypothetical protein
MEKSMTMSQLICRGFAPSEQLSRHYLYRLIKSGKIKVSRTQMDSSLRRPGGPRKELVIEKPSISEPLLAREIVQTIRQARASLLDSRTQQAERDKIVLEVLAGECIQYAYVYAMDNRLIVVDQDPFNPRLQLLILENEQSQVFMLIWISIKQLSRENKTVKTLGFSELMETSYDLYLDYKRNNIEIKHYKRPKSNLMKTSKVAGILLGEHNLDKTLTSMQSKANE